MELESNFKQFARMFSRGHLQNSIYLREAGGVTIMLLIISYLVSCLDIKDLPNVQWQSVIPRRLTKCPRHILLLCLVQ